MRMGTHNRASQIVAVAAAVGSIGLAAPAAEASSLTKAQVITLIKHYEKRGPKGPAGAAGATGARGANGTSAPTYSAGTGLTLAGTVFSVVPTAFQDPFKSGCGFQVVVNVAQDGTPACDYGTLAGSSSVSPSTATQITSTVSATTTLATTGVGGPLRYFLTGQTTLQSTVSSPVNVECLISDGSAVEAIARDTVPANGYTDVAVTGWFNSPANGSVTFACNAASSGIETVATSAGEATTDLTTIALSSTSGLSNSTS
jgi:hypothetical protein